MAQDFSTMGLILSAPIAFSGPRVDRARYTSASLTLRVIVLTELGMLRNVSIFGISVVPGVKLTE